MDRAEWRIRYAGHHLVPEPLSPNASIEWTPLWSLTRQCRRYLPTGYCYYNYVGHDERPYCYADSNGSAAGTTLAGAVLQGFLELVERDAVAIWWYNRIRRPGVDLATCGVPYASRMAELHGRMGRRLWALDLTTDLGVPVIAAVSATESGQRLLVGFGAHPSPALALTRALTELNQVMTMTVSLKAPPTSTEWDLKNPEVSWYFLATAETQPYVAPDPARPLRSLSTMVTVPLHTVSDCQRLVESHHMEMLLLDQSRPDVGLPTVKVVVPGLRLFWPRLAPGRLYDVPVALGWLSSPLAEEALNPVPIFW
jgi:ribosomal protein S12 methylthiotransferase accessory factor